MIFLGFSDFFSMHSFVPSIFLIYSQIPKDLKVRYFSSYEKLLILKHFPKMQKNSKEKQVKSISEHARKI